jgi:hypothetical protein
MEVVDAPVQPGNALVHPGANVSAVAASAVQVVQVVQVVQFAQAH